MSIIAVVTDPGVGGTFLDWSLHYLAGHDTIYLAKKNLHVPLTPNPLKKYNSHGHDSNHPQNLQDYQFELQNLIKTPTDQFHSIYSHIFTSDLINNSNDTKKTVDLAQTHCNKIIYLSLSPQHSLYHCKYQARTLISKFKNSTEINENFDDQHQDFIDVFFETSYQQWQELNLTNTWDQREFLALNLRPNKPNKITTFVDFNFKHYHLDCMEMFNTFNHAVKDLFEYLDQSIVQERWESWAKIYQLWQNMHVDRQRFIWNFDKIIDHIIQGSDMDLSRFNLDIVREAAIQHTLIYKHNLNLKTWQLEKFQNTQQLHALLEPNTHSLSPY